MSKEEKRPQIDLIANLIVRRGAEVLFVRYDAEDDAWWLPGGDLEPYEHPDDAARRNMADLPGLTVQSMKMTHIESFRGRRGWHVMFHYLVDVEGEPGAKFECAWHDPAKPPRTRHGNWETNSVNAALAAGGQQPTGD